MNRDRISVIIPAYNAAATIKRAVDSVRAQTTSVDEIIIVDDGSVDSTADVVRAIARETGLNIRLIQQPNANAASARNHGITLTQYEWIAFLDADDYWEPHKIQHQLDALQRHPDVSVIGSNYYSEVPDQDRAVNPIRRSNWYDTPLRLSGAEAFLLGTMLWTGTVMVRRSVLQRERFTSGLEPAEDRDLWVRLATQETVYLATQPLATAVLELNSISRSDISRDCTQMLRVIERNRSLLNIPNRLLWKSYVRYRWAAIDPTPSVSLPMLCRSFIGWPLPLSSIPAMKSLGRLKRLVFLIRQSFASRTSAMGRP